MKERATTNRNLKKKNIKASAKPVREEEAGPRADEEEEPIPTAREGES